MSSITKVKQLDKLIGKKFFVHFDYYEKDEYTSHVISSIEIDDGEIILNDDENFVYITLEEYEKQLKNK